MRILTTTCVFVLTVSLLAVAVRAAAADADKQAIQGTWHVAKALRDGKEVPPEGDMPDLVFKGDRVVAIVNGKEEDPAAYTLDATKTPRQIDITPQEGGDKGKTLKGIYELDGDKLKLCIAGEGDRPTNFQGAEDSVCYILDRKKTDGK